MISSPKKYTIKDIAEYAGVATSTVSRVLNKKDVRVPVTEKTKKKIYEAIKRFEYYPNIHAKRLSQNKTFVIGLEVPVASPETGAWHAFSDNSLIEVMRGIEEVIINTPYKLLILFRNREYMENKKYIQMFKERSIDALIVWGASRCDNYAPELYKQPVIFINTKPFTNEEYSYIGNNNYAASYEITEYAIKKGRKQFIFLQGPQVSSICIEHKKGFLDALEKHNISIPENNIIECGYDEESAHGIMTRVFQDKTIDFDAVIAMTDEMALGVYEAALEHGKKIPEDFALTGGNESGVLKDKRYPVTTYKVDCFAIGKVAITQIIAELKNDNGQTFFYQQLNAELIEGATV
jgi:LacI family transcriptional regulator, galactose operon repressor